MTSQVLVVRCMHGMLKLHGGAELPLHRMTQKRNENYHHLPVTGEDATHDEGSLQLGPEEISCMLDRSCGQSVQDKAYILTLIPRGEVLCTGVVEGWVWEEVDVRSRRKSLEKKIPSA